MKRGRRPCGVVVVKPVGEGGRCGIVDKSRCGDGPAEQQLCGSNTPPARARA